MSELYDVLEIGDEVVLVDDIIEPACGDHPAFLMGRKGEFVVIREKRTLPGRLPFLVEGPSNPGNPWWAGPGDFEIKAH